MGPVGGMDRTDTYSYSWSDTPIDKSHLYRFLVQGIKDSTIGWYFILLLLRKQKKEIREYALSDQYLEGVSGLDIIAQLLYVL